MDEKKEEEIYQKTCKSFRKKLQEITNPVANNKHNRSYGALCDVITNVILLEINLGKKPWDEIPKRDVTILDDKKNIEDILFRADMYQLAEALRNSLNPNYGEDDVTDEGLLHSMLNKFLQDKK